MQEDRILRGIFYIWGLSILGVILGRFVSQGNLDENYHFTTGEIIGIICMWTVGGWVYMRERKKTKKQK